MTNESLIFEAKALIGNHEDLFESGDLDAVMMNFADDVALVALDSPVVEGSETLLHKRFGGKLGKSAICRTSFNGWKKMLPNGGQGSDCIDPMRTFNLGAQPSVCLCC